MNPSRPFILRPVATSLLMVAILLAGIVAYRSCRSRRCRRSTIRRSRSSTFYPGRQPGRDGLVGHRAARAAVRPDARPEADDVDQLRRRSVITLQFDLELEHRRRRAGGAGGDQRARHVSCRADLPNPPIYSKVNPADAPILTLALTSDDAAAAEGRGPGRHAARAEDLAAARRRAGQHQRRPEAGGAHPGESDARSRRTA